MNKEEVATKELTDAEKQSVLNGAINIVCVVSITWNSALVLLAVVCMVVSSQPPPVEGIVFCFLPTAAMHVIIQSLRAIRLASETQT